MLFFIDVVYNVWRIYRIILIYHGIYAAVSFVFWMLGKTKNMCYWIISWLPQPLPQIEDKKYKEEEADNNFTLLTQS